jgi:hypothetical protein
VGSSVSSSGPVSSVVHLLLARPLSQYLLMDKTKKVELRRDVLFEDHCKETWLNTFSFGSFEVSADE